MNYTRPNDPNHVDEPKDWLNAALIFGKAFSHMVEEQHGVVVELVGDMFNPVNSSNKKVIVFLNGEGQIQIADMPADFKDGQYLAMLSEDEELITK